MNSKLWIRKTISSCLMVAILATYSMVALANSDRAAGELTVSGRTINGETPTVIVNGEAAKTGRTIFSSSSIATPENTSAILSLGKAGEIEVAPNSNLTLSFDDNAAQATLTAGSFKVIRSEQGINVTSNGTSYVVAAGASASATAGMIDDDYKDGQGKCIDANKNGKEECDNAIGWVWVLVAGGAAVAVFVGVTQGNNNYTLGGGGQVISPNR